MVLLGLATVSACSKLKCFSSHGAIGLCDCVSVVNTQEFQFPLCYLGLNDNFVTARVVKTQVFQLPWVWVVVRNGEIVLGDGALFGLER